MEAYRGTISGKGEAKGNAEGRLFWGGGGGNKYGWGRRDRLRFALQANQFACCWFWLKNATATLTFSRWLSEWNGVE